MVEQYEADVVVAGAGMAGLCAAVSALERGARVLVVEKGTRAGGSMRLSGGLIWTFADKSQLRTEIPDGNDVLQDLVVDGLWESMEWLDAQGVKLSGPRDFQWYGQGRSADPAQMTEALVARIHELGGKIALGTGLSENVTDGDGAVAGLRAASATASIEVSAGEIVLATGGFQGNAAMLASHVTPEATNLYLRSNPWSTGDGFLAAARAGAAATPWMDAFYGHTLAAPPARFNQYEFLDVTQRYGPAAVALNLRGRRFCDESAGTGEEYLNMQVARQPSATAVYIVDAKVAEGVPGFAPPRVAIERARLRGAPVAQAARLQDLCSVLDGWGFDGRAGLTTLTQFNTAISNGENSRLSPPRRKHPYALTRPPFSAIQVRAAITFTCGGLAADASMRVLRRSSTVSTLPLVTAEPSELSIDVMPGLYVAGCDAGGISTSGYMGGLATALVTGRIAGEAASVSAGKRRS